MTNSTKQNPPLGANSCPAAKIFPEFYGAQRFVTMFTVAHG
jgi:hypothetical protein